MSTFCHAPCRSILTCTQKIIRPSSVRVVQRFYIADSGPSDLTREGSPRHSGAPKWSSSSRYGPSPSALRPSPVPIEVIKPKNKIVRNGLGSLNINHDRKTAVICAQYLLSQGVKPPFSRNALKDIEGEATEWDRKERVEAREEARKGYPLLDGMEQNDSHGYTNLIGRLKDATHVGRDSRSESQLIRLISGGEMRMLEQWINHDFPDKPRYRLTILNTRTFVRLLGKCPDPISLEILDRKDDTEFRGVKMGRGIVKILISISPPSPDGSYTRHPFAARLLHATVPAFNSAPAEIVRKAAFRREENVDPRFDRVAAYVSGKNPIDGIELKIWIPVPDSLIKAIWETIDNFKDKPAMAKLTRICYHKLMGNKEQLAGAYKYDTNDGIV